MLHRRSAVGLWLAALCIVVAGCGGSHLSSLPNGDRALQPQLNGGGGNLALPTLYVSGQGAVYAYDLSATPSPDATPVSKTTGYYYQVGGAEGLNASIAGIATNSTGDLVIAQNFFSPQGDGNSCQLVYIPARTGTKAANATSTTCSNAVGGHTTGVAVGVTFTGDRTVRQIAFTSARVDALPVSNIQISTPTPSPSPSPTPTGAPFANDVDVLMHYISSGNPNVRACDGSTIDQYEVDRYQAISNGQGGGTIAARTCLTLDQGTTSQYNAIAGSTNGAFFVDYTGGPTITAAARRPASILVGPPSTSDTIERFNANGGAPSNVGTVPGAGPLAVAAELTTNIGYRVVASTTSGVTTIYSFHVSNSSGLTFDHALGTFTNPVGALAVDNRGTIFVGVNQPNGVTKIKVYAKTKTEATNPDYVLNNPVRRPNPSAAPAAVITGIAIAQ